MSWFTKKGKIRVHDPQKACPEKNIASLLAEIPGFRRDSSVWHETFGGLMPEFDDVNEDYSDEEGPSRSSGDLCEYYTHGTSSARSTEKLRNLVIVGASVVRKETWELYEQIASQSDEVRVRAIDVLGMLRDRTNTPVFVWALCDGHWEVRAAAAQALGELREQVLASYLLKALQHESDFTVQQSLVRALGKCKQETSINVLIQLLQDQDQNWLVREAAAWSLGQLQAVPACPLMEVLCSDPDEMVRIAVARALGEIEDLSAKHLLVEAMRGDEDEDVREAAEWALQQLEKKERWQKMLYSIIDIPRTCFLSPTARQKEKESSIVRDHQQMVHKRVLFALTRFFRKKIGFISHLELVHCNQQPTLFLSYCYQQTGQTLRDEVISQIETVMPIEPMGTMLAEHHELLQEVQRRNTELQAKRQWYETTVIIIELPQSETGPTQAVFCGIGCHAVRSGDPLVLDQILRQWRNYFQNPQELSRLQIGYQSCDTLPS